MREINSFFEEPKSYILGLVVGLGSFSGLTFILLDKGLTIFGINANAIQGAFYLVVTLYLGLPAFLPFYHLVLSGRNRPRHYWIIPLIIAVIAMLLWPVGGNYEILFFYASLLIYVGVYFLLLFLGVSLNLSTNTKVVLKENTIVEILVIGGLLLCGLGLKIYAGSFEPIDQNSRIDKLSFEFYKAGKNLINEIDTKKTNGFTLTEKVFTRDSIYKIEPLTFNKIVKNVNAEIRRDKVLDKYRNQSQGVYIMDKSSYEKISKESWYLQLRYYVIDKAFARNFASLIKHYQFKGILTLILSAFLLLITWIQTVSNKEVSDRLRSHFFITIVLIFPLFHPYEESEIKIDNPFGFETNPDTKINENQDVSIPKRSRIDTTILVQDISKLATKEDMELLRKAVDDIDSLITNTNLPNYLEAILLDKDSATISDLKKKLR